MSTLRKIHRKFKRLGLTIFIVLVIFSLLGIYLILPRAVSAEWYDGGWSYRKRLTINRSQVSGTHTDFPVLVTLTDVSLQEHAQSDGDDILFTTADGQTRLDHEIETYDSGNGEVVAWVKMPSLSINDDTSFYIYFGNPGVSSQASASTVWSNSFANVWHLKEDPTSTCTTGKEFCDSAGSNHGDANGSMTQSDQVEGKIGFATDFDGSDDYISTTTSYANPQNLTISAWVKTTTSAGRKLFGFENCQTGSCSSYDRQFYIDTSGRARLGAYDGSTDTAQSASAVNTNTWTYLVGTIDDTGNLISLYVNGGAPVTAANSNAENFTGYWRIGGYKLNSWPNGSDGYFPGQIDEVRYSTTLRSQDWITTEYNNQNSPSTFLTLSSTEEQMATVLNWKFDEGYGSTTNDSTSTGLHGTVGASTAEPERRSEDLCLFGKCLRFDGVDDYVSRTYSSSTDTGLDPGSDGFAVSLWFRHGDNISQNETLVSRYNNGGYDLYMNTTGQICFRVAQNGTALASGDQVCTGNSFNNSNWQFVKAIWDPDSSTNKQSIYISSSLEANSTSITQTGSKSGTSPTLYVGIGNNGTSNPYAGYLDDFKVYRESFSDAKTRADTASANYTEGASAVFGTKDIRESLTNGLIGYWRMEEESEGTCTGGTLDACDLSGSSNHGEWQGTPRSDTGKFGNNLNFDTNDDYLTVADSSSLDLGSRFTISAWVKPNDTSSGFQEIQRDGSSTTATTTSQNNISFNHTVNTQSNQILVLTSAIEDNNNTGISSANFNGVALTSAANTNNSNRRVEIWYLLNPPVGTYTLTVNYSQTVDHIAVGATNIYNAAQQGPTQTATNTNDSASTLVTFTPTNDMSAVLEVIVNGTSTANTLYPLSDQTELYEISTASMLSTANYSTAYENTSTTETEGADIYDNQAHVAAVFAPVSASPGNVVILGKGRDAFQIEMNGSYQLNNYLNSASQNTGQLNSSAWNQVVWSFDSINSVLYINGELVQSTAINQATGTNNSDLIFGQNFDGNIDDVRIYNRPFSEYEVRNFYDWGPEPVTYFNFDEATGSTLNNKGFNQVDATLTCTGGGCQNPTWAPGKFGRGLQFSKTNGSYATFDEPGLTVDSREPFSISLWVYPDDIVSGTDETLLCDDSGLGFCLYLTGTSSTSAKVNLCVDSNTCASNPDTNDSVVTERKWSHIVVTYNGGTNTYLMYVDGIDQLADASAPSVTDITGNDFYIGMFDPTGTPDGCNCRLDDLRIYNYARNQKQVTSDLNLGHPPIGGPVGAPIAYWNFDEGTGSTVYSQGNCVTVCNASYSNFSDPPTGSSGRTPQGRYDKALRFDGSNDYISIGNDYQLRIPNQITLSAWVKPESSDRTIISKYDTPSTASYRLHINSSSQVEFSLSSNGSTINTLTSTDTLAVDGSTWYHIVATYDGATMKLFIDGQADNTLARTGAIYEGGENVIIGGSYQSNSLGRYFDGIIDEVRIYNYALNDNETGQEYFKGATALLGSTSTESDGLTPADSGDRSYCVPGDTSTCSAPLSYLKLNEKSGSTMLDDSGFSNSASFGGTTPTRVYSKYNNGILFNLNNSTYINIDDDSPFDFTTGGLTMMAWFKIESWQNSAADLFGKGTAYYLEQNASTGALNFVTTSLSNVTMSSTTNVTDGAWHHIAAVWDGSTKYLYIDGQVDTSVAATGTLPTNNTDIRIGEPSNTGSGTFRAEVDEIKVYGYGRSVQQVNWDINRGKAASWWKFDDCSGSTAYDAGVNAANATLSIGSSGTYTSVGNCNSGVSSESWAAGRSGQYNSAVALDGNDDKILTTNAASVQNLNQVTISAWIYPTAYNGSGSVVFFEPTASSSSTARIELVLNSNGTVTFRGRAPDGDSLTTWVTTTRTVALNEWTNIIGVFNSVSDSHSVYINKFPATASVSEASFTNSNPAAVPYLGAISSGVNTYNFTGLIDDVRIYPCALTDLQVDVLAAGDGAAVFGPTQGLPE